MAHVNGSRLLVLSCKGKLPLSQHEAEMLFLMLVIRHILI